MNHNNNNISTSDDDGDFFDDDDANNQHIYNQMKGQEDAHDSIDFALSILHKNDSLDDANDDTHNVNDSFNKDKEENDNTNNDNNKPTSIRVKVGIHSGRIIAGVVGSKKPQYALFGDTVNTASRMKTTGKPDYIHISEATYNLVKDDKTLIYEKKETEIKGKGIMTTYLLTSVIGLNYPFIREHVEKKDQFISELYEDDLSNNLNYDKTQNIIGYYSNKINQNNDSNINESIINNNMNTFNTIDGDTNVNTHYCEIIKLRNLKIGTAVGYQLKQKDIYNMTFLNNGLNNDTGTNFNQFIESHKDFDHIKDLRIGMNKLSISDSLYYLNENVIRNEAINEYKNKIKIKSLNTNKNFYEDGHLNDGHFIRPNNEYPNAQNVEEDDDSLLNNRNNKTTINNNIYDVSKELIEHNEEDYKNILMCSKKCKNCNESYCTPNDCINDDHVYHVMYHRKLSNIKKNYLKNIRKDANIKKDIEKEELNKIHSNKKSFNFFYLFSYIFNIFPFIGKINKEEINKSYKKGEQDKSSKRIIALNSEWIFLKFSDKNLEAKYRAHFIVTNQI
ncbi:guanylyl cyclase, putative [Plasmodium sp.]|nr:guanylyl cyclase, putative [Plasmodium sp.]